MSSMDQINSNDDNLNEITPISIPINDELPKVENSTEDEPFLIVFGKDLNITQSQLITSVLLASFYFLTSCFYAMFSPFFPSESIKKDINQTQVGMIFGVFEFVLLILSPVFGKYIEVLGVRFLFVSGIFLSSGSEILFAFLDICPNGFVYFAMCMACRSVDGIGSAMGMSYAIVGHYFPTKITTIVGILEAFNGFGLMVGPVIGGALYELGGFKLPFLAMGGVKFLMFIIALISFPDVKQFSNANNTKKTLTIFPLLKNLRFMLTLLCLLSGSISIGFVGPSISLHLTPLNLNPTKLGSILLFPSLLYVITTPIIGQLCDKHPGIIPSIMFLSTLILATSFSFLGPVPFYHLELNIWIFMGGFIVFGVAIGILVIPVFSELSFIATKQGYPNDIRTQGIISGLFGSVWSLGALVGPTAGGFAVDLIGFNMASVGVSALFLTAGLMFGLYHLLNLCCSDTESLIINEENDENERNENNLLKNS